MTLSIYFFQTDSTAALSQFWYTRAKNKDLLLVCSLKNVVNINKQQKVNVIKQALKFPALLKSRQEDIVFAFLNKETTNPS